MDALQPFLLPGLVLLVYIAFIFPMLRRKRAERDLLATLAEGDEVITKNGIHGIVTALDPTIVYLEVSDGVEMKFERTAIGTKVKNDLDIVS